MPLLPSADLVRRLAAVLCAALLLSSCTSLNGTGDSNYVSGDGNVLEIAPGDREDPVALTGTSLQGDHLDLVDYRGRVVVVPVWGDWCGECHAEAPLLVEASQQLDAAFVGVNIRDSSRDNGLAFERDYGVGYPSVYDGDDDQVLLRFGRYAPVTAPATLVLDAQGRVAALINGKVPSALTLGDVVEKVGAEDG